MFHISIWGGLVLYLRGYAHQSLPVTTGLSVLHELSPGRCFFYCLNFVRCSEGLVDWSWKSRSRPAASSRQSNRLNGETFATTQGIRRRTWSPSAAQYLPFRWELLEDFFAYLEEERRERANFLLVRSGLQLVVCRPVSILMCSGASGLRKRCLSWRQLLMKTQLNLASSPASFFEWYR